MNIFFLSSDPKLAAQYQCNVHIIKMIVESAQLLSTAHRVNDGDQYIDASSGRRIKRWRLEDEELESDLYKATHVNHPSAVWARASEANYQWLYDHFLALCQEYTWRYKRIHATETKLLELLSVPPKRCETHAMTKPKIAISDNGQTHNFLLEFWNSPGNMLDVVHAYRKYYHVKRDSGIDMRWSRPRMEPSWMCNKQLIEEVL